MQCYDRIDYSILKIHLSRNTRFLYDTSKCFACYSLLFMLAVHKMIDLKGAFLYNEEKELWENSEENK